VIYHLTAIWLGFLSLALFASIGLWVLLGLLRVAQAAVDPRALARAALAVVCGATIWSLFRARRLVHTVVPIPLKPTPPASWRGRTGALVTDLHLGNILRAPFLDRVVSKLEAIHPDIIFISGDLFDDTETDYDALLAPWKRLSPPLGTFYVTGNHEEFTRREKFFGPIERAGIRVLNNEKVEVDGVQVIGLHDSEATNAELAHAIMSRLGIDRRRASILVAHQPKAAGVAQDFGVSLQLSGHTHGGQCWPWTWVARRVHGAANYGLSRLGEMLIYTSSGAGTWGPPMRLGTKSEVVELKFE
jgi:predicted MPP superfamily phosphohydrolase